MLGENARYDIVFDGAAMAAIVNETLGLPLELDRALGYEANAGGTSYLAPPDQMMRARIASPRVTVTADRSRPGGVATVKWDDDGVEPRSFALVNDGVISNYCTNRELSVLAPTRQSERRALGCSAAADAATMPLVRAPNLTLRADAEGGSFEELVSHVDNGIAILGGGCMMDQQKLTGQGFADIVYRVRKGKLGPVVPNVSYLIRSPQFWRSVAVLGNESTSVERGFTTWKGQPAQSISNSVRAPAALVRGQVVIDVRTRLWSP
jgi:TldD protein